MNDAVVKCQVLAFIYWHSPIVSCNIIEQMSMKSRLRAEQLECFNQSERLFR